MAAFKAFEEIEGWQKARELTRAVYQVSGERPFAKDFGLRNQIRRASVSIMANIAERSDRSGSGEFGQFLSIAKGSAAEVRSHLYVALDQGYLDQGKFDRLTTLAVEAGRLIGGLMRYLRETDMKGTKFR